MTAVKAGRPSGPSKRLKADSESRKLAPARILTIRHCRPLLPGLHRYTEGKPFRAQVLRTWLRRRLRGRSFKLPSVEDAERLLEALVRGRRGDDSAPLGAWQPQGVRYVDPEGTGNMTNLKGFMQGPRRQASSWVAWHEYGHVYRLIRRATSGSSSRQTYEILCTRGFKRLSCFIHRRTLCASTDDGGRAEFKSSLVFEPRSLTPGVNEELPNWTLIYLHSFSAKGGDYLDYPHYFGVSGASLRVVVPTAPMQEQTCFKDWMVWRGAKLRWRRIKFNSWFDYLTDKAGKCENHLNIQSLLDMRAKLHAMIRREVQRLGGNSKRVLIGGASQGCCVALDAALTYPEELGGVIGLVGHVLGSTPLDQSRRSMPLYLFHEATDKEMSWSWVESTVQRLVNAGFNVISKREADPAGCGHWIQDIEGQWIRSALRRIVHGEGL